MADWKTLAESWCAAYSAWPTIVLPTIEAESGGNTTLIGDHGNALGCGQVWPRWHFDKFQRAGNDVGIAVSQDLATLTKQVIDNPDLSMAVAVLVIKSYWDQSAGSDNEERFVNFSYGYVGPQIPAWDLERRRAIWRKYAGGGGSAAPLPPPPLEDAPGPPPVQPPHRGPGGPRYDP